MTATLERLAVLERQMEHNTTLLSEVHQAVVGDGQHTLVARTAVNESEIGNLKGWRHRGLESIGMTFISAMVTLALSSFGIHLPGRSV